VSGRPCFLAFFDAAYKGAIKEEKKKECSECPNICMVPESISKIPGRAMDRSILFLLVISLSKLLYNFFDGCDNVKLYLSIGGDAV
jgi:hypothetical protein